MSAFHWTKEALDAHQARIGKGAGRIVRPMGDDLIEDSPEPEPKYRNKKVQTEEASFASKKEHRRYLELKLLEKAGEIRALELQKRFVLAEGYEHNGRRVPSLRYFADFVYDKLSADKFEWNRVVEDCKGYQTAVYKIKRHLMFTVHGIRVIET